MSVQRKGRTENKVEWNQPQRELTVSFNETEASQSVPLWRRCLEQVGLASGVFFKGAELVRQVGPGEPPQQRHEFEYVEYRNYGGNGLPL